MAWSRRSRELVGQGVSSSPLAVDSVLKAFDHPSATAPPVERLAAQTAGPRAARRGRRLVQGHHAAELEQVHHLLEPSLASRTRRYACCRVYARHAPRSAADRPRAGARRGRAGRSLVRIVRLEFVAGPRAQRDGSRTGLHVDGSPANLGEHPVTVSGRRHALEPLEQAMQLVEPVVHGPPGAPRRRKAQSPGATICIGRPSQELEPSLAANAPRWAQSPPSVAVARSIG